MNTDERRSMNTDNATSSGAARQLKRILIVCTGNICRSPMATGLLRQRLAEDGLDGDVMVYSVGTWGLDGEPASEHAVHVMAERGWTSAITGPARCSGMTSSPPT